MGSIWSETVTPVSYTHLYGNLIFVLIFHGFPDQTEIIRFTSAGAAADYTNINVCLTVAVVFKILRLSLRALRHNRCV